MSTRDKIELNINVSIRQQMYGHGEIRIEERLELESKSFTEICEILGKFRELADRIKEKGE
jgi:hypothetical protein